VLGVGWDEEKATVASEGWRLIALAAASYQFPELAALAPDRPLKACVCGMCRGSRCEHCFGMGWLPENLA
jgi:hypothetical protein